MWKRSSCPSQLNLRIGSLLRTSQREIKQDNFIAVCLPLIKQPLRENPSGFYQPADARSVASSSQVPSAGTGC